MSIPHLNLPDAGAVDFNSGDIDYYVKTDPVYYVTDNRPLRNLAYRDNASETKINEIIDALGPASSYYPEPQSTPDNTIKMGSGFHVKFTGTGYVHKAASFNSPVFAVVSSGNERYDLVVIDDTGTVSVIQGTPVVAGTGDPWVNHPSLPATKLAIAIVKVTETATVVVDVADITDAREFLNKGGGLGQYIEQPEINIYRPHEQDTPNATVRVEAGQHIKSDGSGAVIKVSAMNSGSFAVVGSGNERYDLLSIDDTGTLNITQGAEVASGTGDPLVNAPVFPSDQLAICIVKVTETVTVVVNDADITDVREFLNKGGGSGGDCPVPTVYQILTSTQGQTVFDLSQSYTVGNNTLWVFRNGSRQIVDQDYVETDDDTITFNYALNAGEQVVCIQMGSSVGNEVVTARETQTATVGQTVFDLSFSYVPGSNDLFVWSGGVLMQKTVDYTETDGDTITFLVGRSPSENITFVRIGVSSQEAPKLWEKHVATAAQTVFNLAGSYVSGGHALQVYVDGVLKIVTDDYVETNNSVVTFNSGMTGGEKVVFFVPGGNIVSCVSSGVIDQEVHTAIASQTVFNLGFNFTVGSDGLRVYVDGVRKLVTTHYNETDQNTVTFLSGMTGGEKVLFENLCKVQGVNEGVLNWHKFPSVIVGQTVFTIPFRFAVGTHQLHVYRNGQYQLVDTDYTEDSAFQITFATAIAAVTEEIVVLAVANARSGSRKHLMAYHDDAVQILAPGQTYRDLQIECTSNTQVVIKSGTKVLADNWTDAIWFTADKTVDITVSGKNGLDTGSEASSTWYYLHAIKNPVTGEVAGLLSINQTNPTLPSGFTLKRLIGAVRNDSGSNFWQFYQTNDHVQYVGYAKYLFVAVVLGGSWNSYSLSSVIPDPIVCSILTDNQVYRVGAGVASDTGMFAGIGTLAGAGNGGVTLAFVPSTAVSSWERQGSPQFMTARKSTLSAYISGDTACSGQLGISGFRLVL